MELRKKLSLTFDGRSKWHSQMRSKPISRVCDEIILQQMSRLALSLHRVGRRNFYNKLLVVRDSLMQEIDSETIR